MRPIDAYALINAKPEFMNERVVRNTKYQTIKDRIYAKAWNTCNSYWLNTIKNAPTIELLIARGSNGVVIPVTRQPGEMNFCPSCGAKMKGVKRMDKRRFEERLKELNQKAIQIGKSFEKPQGEWLWVGHDGAKLKWSCSSCGRSVEDQENFCPDCGRPMKKEEKNENT